MQYFVPQRHVHSSMPVARDLVVLHSIPSMFCFWHVVELCFCDILYRIIDGKI